jgi:very-short-patch-repair endonuclease
MEESVENRSLGTERLVALAERQHRVFSLWQAEAAGVSAQSVQRRARAGQLHRLYHGVYAVGHTHLTLRGRWTAAVLACGPDALLSHQAAAALWDLRGTPSGPIDVTAPAVRRHSGIRSHVSQANPQLMGTTVDAIPVTNLERTILDQAPSQEEQRLRTTLEQVQHRGLLRPERFQTHTGHRGLRPVSAALATLTDEAPWTQSGLERRFLELIRAAGLPQPQSNVTVAGFIVDFYWAQQRLIVEVDGYGHHRSRSAFEADRRKDLRLSLAGFRVVRVTYQRIVHEAPQLIIELAGLIGSAAA